MAAIHREHVERLHRGSARQAQGLDRAVRFKSLQQFFRCTVDEGEIGSSPMERMKPPKVATTPPDVLKPAEGRSLLKTFNGPEFDDRRDTAIITLPFEQGYGFRSW